MATVKPMLEVIEDRILPSASSVASLSMVSLASPPAQPAIAAMTSYVSSTMDNLLATMQQDVNSVVKILTQEFAQEEAYVVQQVDRTSALPPPQIQGLAAALAAVPTAAQQRQRTAPGINSSTPAHRKLGADRAAVLRERLKTTTPRTELAKCIR